MKEKKSVKTRSATNIYKDYHIIRLLFILAVTLLIFSAVKDFGFINWDDDSYITENDVIKKLTSENIEKIFSSFFVSNYQPLTMLSYAIDFQIGGLNPKIFHITSLIIHLINICLVYVFVFKFFSYMAAKNIWVKISRHKILLLASIVSGMFAIHPLQIESVAWLAKRKNLLFAMFFMCSLIYYLYYLEKNNAKYLILSLVFFLFSLLSKGVAVSLSLTLVCIDYVAGRKLLDKKLILEKIPFFVLSLIFGIAAIYAQNRSGAIEAETGYSFFRAILFAAYGFINYLFKILLPVYLSANYPYPVSLTWEYWLCLLLAIGIVVLTIRWIVKSEKIRVFGMLFYLANIFLLLQFIPVGNILMADRYMYIASLGVFIAIGTGYVYLSEKKSFLSNVSLLLFFLFLIVTSSSRIKAWQNSITLWDDVISKYPGIESAWNNRGRAYEEIQNYSGAIENYVHFVNTFKNSKNLCRTYNNMGAAKLRIGDFEGALEAFNQSIKIKPDYFEAYVNRGILFRNMKDYDKSLNDFDRASQLGRHFGIYYNRGITKYNMNDFNGAVTDLEMARKERPEFTDMILGDSYFKLRQYNKAVEIYQIVTKNQPTSSNFQRLAYAFYALGDYRNAVTAYDYAIYMEPRAEIYTNRGCTKMTMQNYTGAIDDFNAALSINRYDAKALYNRGICRIKQNERLQGCTDLQQAKELGYAWAQEQINKYCN